MNDLKSLPLWDMELNEIPWNNKGRTIINTINAYSYLQFEIDQKFHESLLDSDIIIPDGFGIILAYRILLKKRLLKIAGEDLFLFLLKKLQDLNGKVFFLGSSDSTLCKIKNRLNIEYPSIKASFFSPPYKETFSNYENSLINERINNFAPDILFVGMSAPKQEKWVHENKEKINAKIICSIGAVFDFYAKTVRRPPIWMCRYGLEWLGRLLHEPRRLWKRYLIGNIMFLLKILLLKLEAMIKVKTQKS